MTLIAHISDSHLDGGERAAGRFGRVVAHLASLSPAPDAILFSGDIVQTGATDPDTAYAAVAAALPAGIPLVALPGNSDLRASLRRHLRPADDATGEPDRPVNGRHDIGDATIVALDSLVPGELHGALGPGTVGWLRATLAAVPADRPTLIALHHPPVPVGSPPIDALRLRDANDLEAALRGHHNVVAILCGHTHTATATTFAGRPLLIAPGVHSGQHLSVEPAPDPPALLDLSVPPAVALHTMGNGRLTTVFRPVAG